MTPWKVTLSDGSAIDYDYLVCAVGSGASGGGSAAFALGTTMVQLSGVPILPGCRQAGLVEVVGSGLAGIEAASEIAVGHDRIFGAGDAAKIADSPYDDLRMSCATALPIGAHAADNILRLVVGESAEPLSSGYVGQCISLGRRSGVSDGAQQPAPRSPLCPRGDVACSPTLGPLVSFYTRPTSFRSDSRAVTRRQGSGCDWLMPPDHGQLWSASGFSANSISG